MAKTNEQLLIGCEHDGSYVPVSEVKRLMTAAREDERGTVELILLRRLESEIERLEVHPRLGRGLFILKHDVEKIFNRFSAPAGATAPRMDAGIPPLNEGSGAATAKPAGGSPNALECPRRLSNGEVCNKMSPEVRCTKEDECVHQCPSHGHFKIRMDGGIVWLRR